MTIIETETTIASEAPLAAAAIRERTARARRLLDRSREERFAIGAFNADNLTMIRAICRAACESRAPVIIELSQSEVDAIGLANARAIVDNEVRELGIEAYLNLDHAPTPRAAAEAIAIGFEFVHLDCFQADRRASDDAVIAATREVVALARSTGAIVEGEPRYLGGSSTVHDRAPDANAVMRTLSTPAVARAFVAATGVDILAVGIGNVHGSYPTPADLDFQLLDRIRKSTDACLSLHGGSGTSEADYQAAAWSGVSKINVNTDIRIAYRNTLEQQFIEHYEEYSEAKLIGPVLEEVQGVIERKIRAFGSAGAARPTAST